MHIPHTVLYTFPYSADKENLFVNQKVSSLVIISFILTTLMCDSGVILLGEIRCWSLSGFKGLTSAWGFVVKMRETTALLVFYVVELEDCP